MELLVFLNSVGILLGLVMASFSISVATIVKFIGGTDPPSVGFVE